MTVRELIQHLDLFRQDAEVKVEAWVFADREILSVGVDMNDDVIIVT